jgi:hypothetical protein
MRNLKKYSDGRRKLANYGAVCNKNFTGKILLEYRSAKSVFQKRRTLTGDRFNRVLDNVQKGRGSFKSLSFFSILLMFVFALSDACFCFIRR